MGNPLVGAIFFGLLNGVPNTGIPVGLLGAQGLPTPQCVVCGPAKRRGAGDYQAARRLPGSRVHGLSAPWRLGMNDAQITRMTGFTGV